MDLLRSQDFDVNFTFEIYVLSYPDIPLWRLYDMSLVSIIFFNLRQSQEQ